MIGVHNPLTPCLICLQPGVDLIEFKGSCACRPILHTGCLNTWFETSKTCPICRAAYKPTEEDTNRNENCWVCCCLIFVVEIIVMGCLLH